MPTEPNIAGFVQLLTTDQDELAFTKKVYEGSNGFVVDPTDIDMMAERMKTL